MQAKQLLKLLQEPHTIIPEDVQALQNLLHKYPYFQVAYALLAKAACDRDRPSATQAVQIASVYATDRSHLKKLLDKTRPSLASTVGATTPVASDGKSLPKVEMHDFVNDYIKALQKRAQRKTTKSQDWTQLDSIQDLLKRGIAFKTQPSQSISHEDFKVDLTQKSTAFHDDLATETLAKILWQQGKLQRALAIYKKLMLKFPEKKTYFASLIEEINCQL